MKNDASNNVVLLFGANRIDKTPDGSRKGSMKLGLSVLRQSVRLSRRFLRIGSLVFLNFGMLLETQKKLCVIEPDFLGKNLFSYPKNGWGKWVKNGAKIGCFEFIEKFGH